jgi:hypothetical protein
MKLPQLSMRELFLLVALVAMGCGWWVDRQLSTVRTRDVGKGLLTMLSIEQARRAALENAVEQQGYTIQWQQDSPTVELLKRQSE